MEKRILRRSLASRLDLKPIEQSPIAMRLAGAAFLFQWFFGVVAGLLYRHFAPVPDEYLRFICMLMASLATFTVSVVAFMELMKAERSSRSIGMALAWINVLVYMLLLFYTRFWILAFNQVVFALCIVFILTGKTTTKRLSQSILLFGLGFFLMVGPAVYYRILLYRADVQLEKAELAYFGDTPLDPQQRYVRVFKDSEYRVQTGPAAYPNGSESVERAIKAESTLSQLVFFSAISGEKNMQRALVYSKLALATALTGKLDVAYGLADKGTTFADSPRAYKTKALIFSLINNERYMNYEIDFLDEAELSRIEQRIAQKKHGELIKRLLNKDKTDEPPDIPTNGDSGFKDFDDDDDTGFDDFD